MLDRQPCPDMTGHAFSRECGPQRRLGDYPGTMPDAETLYAQIAESVDGLHNAVLRCGAEVQSSEDGVQRPAWPRIQVRHSR